MNSYATHVPILAWAVANTAGGILELGAGAYSTPLIHTLAGSRRVFSFETEEEYVADLGFLKSPTHEIVHASNPLQAISYVEGDIGLAFVDCAPSESRQPCVEQLRSRAAVIVVHDTDKAAYYNLVETLASFPNRVDCKWFDRWTTVISMRHSLDDLQKLVSTV